MRFILKLLVGTLLIWSFLPQLPVESVWLWKMSLAASEYGHWLSLVSAIFLLYSCYRQSFFIGFLFLITALQFSIPSLQLFLGFDRWRSQMSESFPLPSSVMVPEPSFLKLWSGSFGLNSSFETYSYATLNDEKLSIEFFRAKSDPSGPRPWVLVIPGGYWKEADTHLFWELNSYLSSRGISVAAISYRVLPRWHWPAPEEDVLKSIEYIKGHAKELDIDPQRWVILGRSAGGQIGESIAYGPKMEGLKGGIFFYAPADLSFAYEHSSPNDIVDTTNLLREYVGANIGLNPKESKANKIEDLSLDNPEVKKAFAAASPYDGVDKDSPPTLLLHGPRDTIVWSVQSDRLYKKLTENHVPTTLIDVQWGTHGFDYNFSGPGGQLSTYAVEFFLRKVLF